MCCVDIPHTERCRVASAGVCSPRSWPRRHFLFVDLMGNYHLEQIRVVLLDVLCQGMWKGQVGFRPIDQPLSPYFMDFYDSAIRVDENESFKPAVARAYPSPHTAILTFSASPRLTLIADPILPSIRRCRGCESFSHGRATIGHRHQGGSRMA